MPPALHPTPPWPGPSVTPKPSSVHPVCLSRVKPRSTPAWCPVCPAWARVTSVKCRSVQDRDEDPTCRAPHSPAVWPCPPGAPALLGPEMELRVLHTWAVPWAPTPWPQPHPRPIRVPSGYGWPLLVSPEASTLHKGRNRRPAQHPSTARHLDRRVHARLRADPSLSLGRESTSQGWSAGQGVGGARLCWAGVGGTSP